VDGKTPLGFGARDVRCPRVRRVPRRPWAMGYNAVGVKTELPIGEERSIDVNSFQPNVMLDVPLYGDK
jgi:hypothetical protein